MYKQLWPNVFQVIFFFQVMASFKYYSVCVHQGWHRRDVQATYFASIISYIWQMGSNAMLQ